MYVLRQYFFKRQNLNIPRSIKQLSLFEISALKDQIYVSVVTKSDDDVYRIYGFHVSEKPLTLYTLSFSNGAFDTTRLIQRICMCEYYFM